MRLEYRRTFSQFVDTYLGTYFGTAGQTVWRLLGGPTLIITGVLLFIQARPVDTWLIVKIILFPLSVMLMLYGAIYLARPALNLLLVWLRRDEFLGETGELIALELHSDYLRVFEGESHFDVPVNQIAAIRRRSDNAWILTQSNNLVYIPRAEETISGDPDAFLENLEFSMALKEREST